VKAQCEGYTRLIRYADDYVVCFQIANDAKWFEQAMTERLKQFSLELAPEKTQRFEFGPFAQSKEKARGERAVTFDFPLLLANAKRTAISDEKEGNQQALHG
jgi:RNA-directed DNA polymerase